MRNTFALIIALLAVLASSCSQDELLEKRRLSYIDDTEFFASFEADSILSRTYIEEDAETSKLYLRWTKADEITIFRGNTLNQRYQYKGETGDNSAGFRQIASDDFVSYNDLDNPTNYAVYPYHENTRITEKGVLSVTLPSVQKYAEKSFGLGANSMVAVTQHTGDVNLLFKNVCGYFKFKLYGEDLTIKSVTLQGNNNENLAGKANVTSAYGSLPSMTLVSDTTKTLTLDCGENGVKVGSTKETATEFWFVVPPTQFTKGFTITVTDTEGGKFTKTTEKVFEIKRNIVKPISAIEVETVPDYSAMTVPDDEIWYVTTDGMVLDITKNNANPFDKAIISNTYVGNKGIIKCAGTITAIHESVFYDQYKLVDLYLPNSIKSFARHSISWNSNLSTMTTPLNLEEIANDAVIGNYNLTSFIGKFVSDDSRCLIVDDVLYSFAPKGIKTYSIPEGVQKISSSVFNFCRELESVTLPNSLKWIAPEAFMNCSSLRYVTIPNSLERVDPYIFNGCSKLEAFYGNNKFVSKDNKCFFSFSSFYDDGGVTEDCELIKFAGYNISHYNIPEGVVLIQNGSIDSKTLTSLNIPMSVKTIGSISCENLEYVYGPNSTNDNKGIVVDSVLIYVAPKNTRVYQTSLDVKALGDQVFNSKDEIEEVVVTDNVTKFLGLGYMFGNCEKLKKIVLSSTVRDLGYDPFDNSKSIEEVYCRAMTPPNIKHNSPNDIPISFAGLTIYVPSQSLNLYLEDNKWQPYKSFIKGYNYTDLPEPDYYISTDYSQNGKVTTLQTAAKGNGIDIVLMGDGYSDRQITNGTYRTNMENLYNNLFTEEPYKSFKNHFNVYYVNVVSATEGYEHNNTALSGYFGSGTQVGGNDEAVFTYGLNAISEEAMDEALLIVAMNSDNYAGTCYMYYPTSTVGAYGNGPSVAYFPKGGDAETFAQLLHHEACGHGFAKLADEYAYQSMGTISASKVTATEEQQANWGWWKNIDFTGDTSAIRWSKFINDSRYANEGLGAYEGGFTYWSGVWRPTENSIMRYNTGGFNAPSREAIYYRIHKLAYGSDWQYDYEKFVEWDAINRQTSSTTHAKAYKPANFKPLHAPVVKRQSWKNAK